LRCRAFVPVPLACVVLGLAACGSNSPGAGAGEPPPVCSTDAQTPISSIGMEAVLKLGSGLTGTIEFRNTTQHPLSFQVPPREFQAVAVNSSGAVISQGPISADSPSSKTLDPGGTMKSDVAIAPYQCLSQVGKDQVKLREGTYRVEVVIYVAGTAYTSNTASHKF
jgi:hypothetical protein